MRIHWRNVLVAIRATALGLGLVALVIAAVLGVDRYFPFLPHGVLSPTPTLTPTPTPTPTPEPTPYERLLALVPDTAETRHEVWVNDYVRMHEVYDFSLPGPDDGDRALAEYVAQLRLQSRPAPAPWVSGYDDFAATANPMFRQYLAFDLRTVDQSAIAGLPPREYEVILGRFDPEATDQTLRACSECPPPLRVEYRGIRFYSWGDDFEANLTKRNNPPAFDHVGRGGRISVQESYVLRTVWTEGMTSLVDASLGQRRSLGDLEEFRVLAEGLAELEAYSAYLSDQIMCITRTLSRPGYGLTPELWEALLDREEARLLRPYRTFAMGIGKDKNGRYLAVVLFHDDVESATENVELLRRRIDETTSWSLEEPWADVIDDVETHTEGRLLLAKLRGDRVAANWTGIVWDTDPLLLTEDVPSCIPPPGLPTPTPTLTPTGTDLPRKPLDTIEFDDGNNLRIRNRHYEIVLSKENGAVLGIWDAGTGEQLTMGSRNGCLWGATLSGGEPGYVGGCSFPGDGSNRFTYQWDQERATLSLEYEWDTRASQRVDATVEIKAGRESFFDLRIDLRNNWGASVEQVLIPSDLVFDERRVTAAYAPFILPGVRLSSGFFSDDRSYAAIYPGEAFAPYMALEVAGSHLSLYMMGDPESEVQPVRLDFEDDDSTAPESFYIAYALQTWISDGQRWESPAIRVRIGEPPEETILDYRRDSEIADYASLDDKLG